MLKHYQLQCIFLVVFNVGEIWLLNLTHGCPVVRENAVFVNIASNTSLTWGEMYCQEGYTLIGGRKVICIDGVWMRTSLCVRKDGTTSCPELQLSPNVQESRRRRRSVSFACKLPHYFMIGKRRLTCNNNMWSGLPPVCYDPTRNFPCSSSCYWRIQNPRCRGRQTFMAEACMTVSVNLYNRASPVVKPFNSTVCLSLYFHLTAGWIKVFVNGSKEYDISFDQDHISHATIPLPKSRPIFTQVFVQTSGIFRIYNITEEQGSSCLVKEETQLRDQIMTEKVPASEWTKQYISSLSPSSVDNVSKVSPQLAQTTSTFLIFSSASHEGGKSSYGTNFIPKSTPAAQNTDLSILNETLPAKLEPTVRTTGSVKNTPFTTTPSTFLTFSSASLEGGKRSYVTNFTPRSTPGAQKTLVSTLNETLPAKLKPTVRTIGPAKNTSFTTTPSATSGTLNTNFSFSYKTLSTNSKPLVTAATAFQSPKLSRRTFVTPSTSSSTSIKATTKTRLSYSTSLGKKSFKTTTKKLFIKTFTKTRSLSKPTPKSVVVPVVTTHPTIQISSASVGKKSVIATKPQIYQITRDKIPPPDESQWPVEVKGNIKPYSRDKTYLHILGGFGLVMGAFACVYLAIFKGWSRRRTEGRISLLFTKSDENLDFELDSSPDS